MKVYIKLLSRMRNITIKIENDVLYFNGKKKTVDLDYFLTKLTQIVSFWEPIMVNKTIIDGERYEVVLEQGEEQAKYIGQGKYPKNYSEFIRLMEEVKKC